MIPKVDHDGLAWRLKFMRVFTCVSAAGSVSLVLVTVTVRWAGSLCMTERPVNDDSEANRGSLPALALRAPIYILSSCDSVTFKSSSCQCDTLGHGAARVTVTVTCDCGPPSS